MILVGHAESGKSPRVLQVGIEGEAVVLDGQRSAVTKNLDAAREIVAQNIFETFAPARGARRETAEGEGDRRHIEARVESAAAVEPDFIGVEFVKIVEDAADGEALVVV